MKNDHILFVDSTGVTIVSRGGRLYVRHQDEYSEVGPMIRIIVASGFGFVITSDAIGVCVRRHIEIIITDYAQSFTTIYAPYVPRLPNRANLAMRLRQFAAVADRNRKLQVAKDIVRRKIMAEHSDNNRNARASILTDLSLCKTIDAVRHAEAKSAQEWWQQWKDFEMIFRKGFDPPEQWRTFRTRYIGRVQGKSGELPRQFTARFAETPLQALHNFAVGIAVARITRVIAAQGLDPCFGLLHDGKKPGRFSLAWDAVEVFRPELAAAMFKYVREKKFERADFALQNGVVRLSSWIARECTTIACQAAPLTMLVREVRKIERLL